MKIRFISDTHGLHEKLEYIPVDIIVHAGDESNSKNVVFNDKEFENFWGWWSDYPATYKILVPGNHSAYLASPMSKSFRHLIKANERLHHDYILIDRGVEVGGIKFWGSPYTPEYNDWHFSLKRNRSYSRWSSLIPEDVDILVTHGPRRGILDLTKDFDGSYVQCGDSGLGKVIDQVRPKIHVFGHLHDEKGIYNYGKLERDGITYINASCQRNHGLGFNHGFILEV